MSDRENQEDEIEALQSIFTEEEFQTFKRGNLICGQFNSFVTIPDGFTLLCHNNLNLEGADVTEDCSGPSNEPLKNNHQELRTAIIKHLPPIELRFTLPEEYPSKLPPKFCISCVWLSQSQLKTICCKLEKTWKENLGFAVLFSWMQILKEECLPLLGLNNSLDITDVIRENFLREQRRRFNEQRIRNDRTASGTDKISSSDKDVKNEPSKDASSGETVLLNINEERVRQALLVKESLYCNAAPEFEENKDSSTPFNVEEHLYERSPKVGSTEDGDDAHKVRKSLYESTSSENTNDEALRIKNSLYECSAENSENQVLDSQSCTVKETMYVSRPDIDFNNDEALDVKKSLYETSPSSKDTGFVRKGASTSEKKHQNDFVKAGPSTSKGQKSEPFRRISNRRNGGQTQKPRNYRSKNLKKRKPSGRCFQIISVRLHEPLWNVIIDYNKARKRKDFDLEVFCCGVCYEEKIGLNCVELDLCGHVFCRECVTSHLEVKIKEGRVRQLTCLERECESEFHPSEVKNLVSPELFNKYDQILLATTLDTMNVTYCPRKFCQYPVSPENESMAVCPQCQYCFCLYCKMVYHGVEPCRLKLDFEQTKALIDEYQNGSAERKAELEKRYGKKHLRFLTDKALSESWISTYSKQCPKCNASIERTYGCNKMTCARCKTSFCWLCMADLSSVGDPYSHFQTGRCAEKLFHGTVDAEDDDFAFEDDDEEEEEFLLDDLVEIDYAFDDDYYRGYFMGNNIFL